MSYQPPVRPAQKKNTWKWVVGVILGGVVALCGLGFAGALASFDAKPQGDALSPVIVPGDSPPPSAKGTVKAPQKAAPALIGEGMWLVGTDVASGTYKTAGAAESVLQFCSWSVKKSEDPGSDVLDFGSSSETKEPGRVVLKKGNIFETSGCQKWVKQ